MTNKLVFLNHICRIFLALWQVLSVNHNQFLQINQQTKYLRLSRRSGYLINEQIIPPSPLSHPYNLDFFIVIPFVRF